MISFPKFRYSTSSDTSSDSSNSINKMKKKTSKKYIYIQLLNESEIYYSKKPKLCIPSYKIQKNDPNFYLEYNYPSPNYLQKYFSKLGFYFDIDLIKSPLDFGYYKVYNQFYLDSFSNSSSNSLKSIVYKKNLKKLTSSRINNTHSHNYTLKFGCKCGECGQFIEIILNHDLFDYDFIENNDSFIPYISYFRHFIQNHI
ncbi:uncharacterized protein ASCRUDRAFT_77342 [Ascoidea rubescens DSM 1968]|uniref:Uncharacterized protein n=1 Tax=Ascoidea rubescens DSM 1968 TaxID=1344418 RepID=A0A1D2VCC5_9ASCO|nr:hypothetical protein ASCRUDRAFT_77342 [Ascoidea rubescens DSM 1968]ODV59275.1 hypothetical protein ASCRUDRAFT_77342 [Ascoidea rubescens DSM 1968]